MAVAEIEAAQDRTAGKAQHLIQGSATRTKKPAALSGLLYFLDLWELFFTREFARNFCLTVEIPKIFIVDEAWQYRPRYASVMPQLFLARRV